MEAAVAFETHPAIRPWSWYTGAFNQYHTAFLLLVEIFAFPMRKEADRIWKILDYVFEVPSGMARDRKGRLILTNIRDRTGMYSEARKVRAPTMMLQRLAQDTPKFSGSRSEMPNREAPQGTLGSLMIPSREAPTPSVPSLDGSSDTLSNSDGLNAASSIGDDLMADIDWVSQISMYFGNLLYLTRTYV